MQTPHSEAPGPGSNTKTCEATVPTYLQWSHPQLLAAAALGDLGQVVDQPLEDVGGVQVAVVVDIDVDDTLGVW